MFRHACLLPKSARAGVGEANPPREAACPLKWRCRYSPLLALQRAGKANALRIPHKRVEPVSRDALIPRRTTGVLQSGQSRNVNRPRRPGTVQRVNGPAHRWRRVTTATGISRVRPAWRSGRKDWMTSTMRLQAPVTRRRFAAEDLATVLADQARAGEPIVSAPLPAPLAAPLDTRLGGLRAMTVQPPTPSPASSTNLSAGRTSLRSRRHVRRHRQRTAQRGHYAGMAAGDARRGGRRL